MFPGIKGYGVYIPRYRIKREDIAKSWQGKSRGENSVANSDEDIITMSTEAAQNAVRHAGIDPASIGAIYLGSTSAPNIEQSLLGTIAETLGTNAGTDMMCVGESTRAGTGAVKVCLDAIKAGTINNGLVIAADCRPASPGSDQELNFGVGAAAYILSSDNTVANIEEVFTYSTGFRDLWREAGSSYVKEYEPKLTRGIGRHDHMVNATKGLLASIGIGIDQFQHVVLYQPDARIPRVIAQTLGIKPEQTEKASIFPQLGDTGSSSVLLGLASVLDHAKPGDRILLVSYGSGISDAISLVVTNEIENKRNRGVSLIHYLDSKEYIDYLTYLKLNKALEKGGEPAKMALPPLSPVVVKEGPELHRLIGAKCSKCGYVNFPPSERKICIRCGNTSFEQVLLPRTGKIHTFCISYYLPKGMESPLPIIIADLDDGTRHRALGTEMKPEEVKIDMPVELVLRELASEGGLNLYANVFRPPR